MMSGIVSKFRLETFDRYVTLLEGGKVFGFVTNRSRKKEGEWGINYTAT